MKNFWIAVAAAGAMAGCANVNKQPITSAGISHLKDQPLVQTKRPLPDFAAMTAGKAAFALVGAALMISEGNALVAKNQIADPAGEIAANLAKELEAAHGARVVPEKIAVASGGVSDVSAATGSVARFVVDVETINWSFAYFPADWAHYRVIYTARARLIDTANKTIVAEGFCSRVPASNAGAPTLDELTGNGAELLKKELSVAAAECVKTLKSEMLAL